MAAPPTSLTIPSELNEIGQVQDAILAQVEKAGYDKHAVFAIRLALDEALANAIRHGNCGDPTKKVTVKFDVTPKRVSITVCDEGCGFHPEDVPDPTLEENLVRPNGRGVMLMNAYMTEVKFNDAGNCVTLIKARGCRKPEND